MYYFICEDCLKKGNRKHIRSDEDKLKILETVIEQVKVPGYVPKAGKVVVDLYKKNELSNIEDCLYVIAELLHYCTI